jgi:hypothetical protein
MRLYGLYGALFSAPGGCWVTRKLERVKGIEPLPDPPNSVAWAEY